MEFFPLTLLFILTIFEGGVVNGRVCICISMNESILILIQENPQNSESFNNQKFWIVKKNVNEELRELRSSKWSK